MVLDTQGQLRLQKRFDYQPVAFTTYPVRQQLLISVRSTTSILAFGVSQPCLDCIWCVSEHLLIVHVSHSSMNNVCLERQLGILIQCIVCCADAAHELAVTEHAVLSISAASAAGVWQQK